MPIPPAIGVSQHRRAISEWSASTNRALARPATHPRRPWGRWLLGKLHASARPTPVGPPRRWPGPAVRPAEASVESRRKSTRERAEVGRSVQRAFSGVTAFGATYSNRAGVRAAKSTLIGRYPCKRPRRRMTRGSRRCCRGRKRFGGMVGGSVAPLYASHACRPPPAAGQKCRASEDHCAERSGLGHGADADASDEGQPSG